jgi:fatty aldehyde-generating acyl-ACP reductase
MTDAGGDEPPSGSGREPRFALIGHQESWAQIARMIGAMRGGGRAPLPEAELRQVFPRIPPRVVLRSRVQSFPTGASVSGVYVETFITPAELEAHAFRSSIEKVHRAIACATREGARIASLGGFTSIVLEARAGVLQAPRGLALTTGNSLTVALIVKGVVSAAALLGVDLSAATLLVVGSTGDIGSACATYLGRGVKRLLLAARNADRLLRQEQAMRRLGFDVRSSTDVRSMLARADIVVCAASVSAPVFNLADCRPDALVCDAGYPKNLVWPQGFPRSPRLFWGGMGRVLGGWRSDPALLEAVYAFPAAGVAHGCLLEGVVLAMEGRFEPFSQGRGQISPERIEEIWSMAQRHGVVLAPFFGPEGRWPEMLNHDATYLSEHVT